MNNGFSNKELSRASQASVGTYQTNMLRHYREQRNMARAPAPNNGLGNNPLGAINTSILKRGSLTRRRLQNNGLRKSRRSRKNRR